MPRSVRSALVVVVLLLLVAALGTAFYLATRDGPEPQLSEEPERNEDLGEGASFEVIESETANPERDEGVAVQAFDAEVANADVIDAAVRDVEEVEMEMLDDEGAEARTSDEDELHITIGASVMEGREQPLPGTSLGTAQIQVEPSGARVALLGPDRFVHVSTDFQHSRVENLPAGHYLVVGTREGFTAAGQGFEVNGGQVETVMLELERIEPR